LHHAASESAVIGRSPATASVSITSGARRLDAIPGGSRNRAGIQPDRGQLANARLVLVAGCGRVHERRLIRCGADRCARNPRHTIDQSHPMAAQAAVDSTPRFNALSYYLRASSSYGVPQHPAA
jgi:hypothetical protein